MPVLEINELCSGYGNTQILWDVSMAVDEGEMVVLIGANGSGKTTLMYSLMQVNRVWSGSVRLDGEDISGLPVERVAKCGMTLVPQGRRLFGDLTVAQNLQVGTFGSTTRRNTASSLSEVYDLLPTLAERRSQRASTLSGGEQQMCAIGRALMGKPRILLIDEMSLGLSPVLVERLMTAIARVRDEGVTVLLVEQDVDVALEVADRAYVLEGGRITMEGAAMDIRNDDRVRAAYLGQ